MRVVGVISEYDPFHNGHEHHLREAKRLSAADYVVCAMSGHFTQRGAPALLDKWSRAEMALRCGADAVFELPAAFAVRDAERFARGGVALLASLGVVTHLSFGSESGSLQSIRAAADAGEDTDALRRGLAAGQSFARARGAAAGFEPGAPNDALAVEYIKALRVYAPDIEPAVVRRTGAGFHSEALLPMASATAVRAAIRRGEDVFASVPAAAHRILFPLLENGCYQRENGLDAALLAKMRAMTPESLREIADVGEGLENRLLRAAQRAIDRESLLSAVKCKRYTRARLSRVLTQTLLGFTKDIAAANARPSYARLLGFRRDAGPLLSAIGAGATLPVVTRAAPFARRGDSVFTVDLLAGDLWALGCEAVSARAGRRDLTEPVRIVDTQS